MGRTISSSLAILATLLILSAVANAAGPCPSRRGPITISPFCQSATKKCRCSRWTEGATAWPEAMTNTINTAIRQINALKPIVYGVTARLTDNLAPANIKGIDKSCKWSFDNVVSQLEDAIGYIKDDPKKDLASSFKGLWLSECLDTLELNEVSSPEVASFDQYLIGVTDILVSVLKTNPKYAD